MAYIRLAEELEFLLRMGETLSSVQEFKQRPVILAF